MYPHFANIPVEMKTIDAKITECLLESGKIAVTPKITKASEDYADVVRASEAGLEGFHVPAYRIKPEFQKFFPSDEYSELDE